MRRFLCCGDLSFELRLWVWVWPWRTPLQAWQVSPRDSSWRAAWLEAMLWAAAAAAPLWWWSVDPCRCAPTARRPRTGGRSWAWPLRHWLPLPSPGMPAPWRISSWLLLPLPSVACVSHRPFALNSGVHCWGLSQRIHDNYLSWVPMPVSIGIKWSRNSSEPWGLILANLCYFALLIQRV